MKRTTLLILAMILLAATLTPVFAGDCAGGTCGPERTPPPCPPAEGDAEIVEFDSDKDGNCDDCDTEIKDGTCPNCVMTEVLR